MDLCWWVVKFTTVLSLVTCSLTSGLNASTDELLERLTKGGDYKKRIRPMLSQDLPTRVTMSLYIHSLSSISEINMEYIADVYFRQTWIDHRLQTLQDDDQYITLGYYWYTDIWLPDPYFMNSKQETFHIVSVPNVGMRLYPDGTLYYSQRLSLLLSCNMHLQAFPLDEQTCGIKIMSYGYTTDEIVFEWLNVDAIIIDSDVTLPEYDITETVISDCTQVFTVGNYTCVGVDFKLKRRIQFYLVRTYFPSILIVILSWMNFWIDPSATPARVSLGLLCVLTMTAQTSGAMQGLPRVSYIKALDVWLSTCLVFVFSALLEFAIVNLQGRHPDKPKCKQRKERRDSTRSSVNCFDDDSLPDTEVSVIASSGCRVTSEGNTWMKVKGKDMRTWVTPEKIDYISRISFPVSFFLFNTIYWTFYLT